MKAKFVSSLLTTLIVASACSGSPVPIVPRSSASDSSATGASAAHRTSTRLTIHVPKRVRIRHRHGFRYVSPSTQSLSYAINPVKGCKGCTQQLLGDDGLTLASPNCAPVDQGTTCTFPLPLAPGHYTGTIATYDGPAGCQTVNACNTLSSNQSFPLTVTAGRSNAPSIALYGVASQLEIEPVGNNARVLGNGNQNVTVSGLNSVGTFALYGLDADNNLILGPGSPTFTLPSQPSINWTASIRGNLLTFTTGSSFQGNDTPFFVQVGPSCVTVGSPCSFTLHLYMGALVAMADSTKNTVHVVIPGVGTGADFGTSSIANYATVTNGVSGPTGVAFNDATAELFVANGSNSTVTVYVPPYTGAPIATLHVPFLGAIAVDAAGDVAAASNTFGSDSVEVFFAPSYGVPAVQPLSHPATSLAFAYGSNPDLWVGTSGSVAAYAAPYTAPAAHTVAATDPVSIDLDGNENLYVSDATAETVTKYLSASSYAAGPSATGLFNAGCVLVGYFVNICQEGVVEYGALGPSSFQVLFATGIDGSAPCLGAVDYLGDLWAAGSAGTSSTMLAGTGNLFTYVSYSVSAMAAFPGARLAL
ncbi:MAG: hypothetical protein JOY98_12925 [Candidatus Eremiobacteraeota bacterium]|nr:hypothetical protein [Candidatus Eremiobacteraeota bacterium]